MNTYQNFITNLTEMKTKNIGLMTKEQYMNIGYLLSALEPVNLLVFGLGGDAYLTGGILATMGINDVTKSVSDSGIDPVNKINSINFKIGVIF